MRKNIEAVAVAEIAARLLDTYYSLDIQEVDSPIGTTYKIDYTTQHNGDKIAWLIISEDNFRLITNESSIIRSGKVSRYAPDPLEIEEVMIAQIVDGIAWKVCRNYKGLFFVEKAMKRTGPYFKTCPAAAEFLFEKLNIK